MHSRGGGLCRKEGRMAGQEGKWRRGAALVSQKALYVCVQAVQQRTA